MRRVLVPEDLYQLYVVEGRGILEVARLLHCRNEHVLEGLRAHGWNRKQQWMTREWMYEHHVERRESIPDIAAQLGLKDANILKYLHKFGIPIRYRTRGCIRVPQLNDHDFMYQRYVVGRQTIEQIAAEVGCTFSSVARAILRLKLPLHGAMAKNRNGLGPGREHAFTRYRRRTIFTRDEFKCQIPGCPTLGTLHAHHIIPRRLGGKNDAKNGITLCKPCHLSIHYRETEYISLFQSIIASRDQEPPT